MRKAISRRIRRAVWFSTVFDQWIRHDGHGWPRLVMEIVRVIEGIERGWYPAP